MLELLLLSDNHQLRRASGGSCTEATMRNLAQHSSARLLALTAYGLNPCTVWHSCAQRPWQDAQRVELVALMLVDI